MANARSQAMMTKIDPILTEALIDLADKAGQRVMEVYTAATIGTENISDTY
jgi:hypothetical protein